MSKPLVSIIVCTYNRAGLLKEALPSMFAQSYEPAEIVVVDDGSTDNTREVIARYGDKIRYFRQGNKGLAAARTVACRQLARGEYIAFQDDDDVMPPDRIICLYEALRLHPRAVLAVGDWETMDAEGNLTGQRITFGPGKNGEPHLIEDGYKAVMWPMLTPLPNATLFRRSDGERINWLDARFSRSSDTDFFARLGRMGPIVYVPRVVSYYRTGHARMWSNSSRNNLLCEYNNFLLYEKHLSSVSGIRMEMLGRLRQRMLDTLKKLAFLSRFNEEIPEMAGSGYVKRGLSLLGPKERLSYAWYAGVRVPLRRAIKG